MRRPEADRPWRQRAGILLALAMGAVLAACGGAPAGGDDQSNTLDPLDPTVAYLTDDEAAERVQALKNDAVSIGNGFVDGVLNAAVQGLPQSVDPSGVPAVHMFGLGPVPLVLLQYDDSIDHATGTFEYDEATLNWTYSAEPTNELIARWRSASDGDPRMELRVVWGAMVTVVYPEDAVTSMPGRMPTGWTAELRRNDVVIADLDAEFGFRSCDGVLMAEPSRWAFTGFVGDGAARADIRELVLEAVGDDRVQVRADLDVRSGSLQLGVDATLTADLVMERDAACWPVQPEAVELTGTARVSGPGPLVLVRGDVTASYDPAVGGYALALRDGRFVSGDERVDLVATIAADEANPASRLFLTFAGGVVRDLTDFVDTFGLAE